MSDPVGGPRSRHYPEQGPPGPGPADILTPPWGWPSFRRYIFHHGKRHPDPIRWGRLALEALQGLPVDATVDDAIERLLFLAKIDAGLAELDEGKGIPHDEVKGRLGM